jgi:ABC-type multidrug transport system fused ATPase/permease subunit
MPLFSFLQLSKSSDIINRLSRDIEKIKYPMKFLQYVLRDTLGVLIITIYSMKYSLIILFLVTINIILSSILYIYFIDRAKLYNNVERDSHSPLINLFSESLKGSLYIQVYDKSTYFNTLLDKRLDNVLKMNIFKSGAMAMFQMYHELMCILNLGVIVLYCVVTKYVKGEISKEDISILLTFSINLIETLCSLFLSILDMSLNKIYFDRLLQYENTEQEINVVDESKIVKFSYGDIKFEDVCMKYKKNSELILKNINIEIKIGEKIAIIGRTGSGKSSLILCLLRIIQDSELIKGNISINGNNINNIDINELRKKISVISQKPFIFNDCSVKENIDPHNLIKDKAILLNKIEKYQFMQKFINKYIKGPNDLDEKIINLSLSEGEKQIICLARIMIQNNKIIIMDEATSNIDLETEKLIYDDFINLISKDTIIISILHKLDYLNYYDKVIEISDDGKINKK